MTPSCNSSTFIPRLPDRKNKTLFISVFNTMVHRRLHPPPKYDFFFDVKMNEKPSTIYVILRPGLVEFIQAAKKACFDIVTFSWWPKDHVLEVLNKIDPTGEIITHRLYLDYYRETRKPKDKMDINRTGRMLDRSVIIDGNPDPELFVTPWCNVIKVSRYTGDDNDVELSRLLRFLEAQESFSNLQDLVHVRSLAPESPELPLPSTTRKTLFLDLDETLICNVSRRDCKPPDSYDFTTEKKYIIFRPGVDKLLQAATDSDYEIVIFTAGSVDYAAPIIDKLDPNGLIAHRLFQDSCRRNNKWERVKDPSLTGRSLDRCIMVDDAWWRVIQTKNVVKIKPFRGDMQDSELTKLLPYFSIENKDEDPLDLVSHINRQLCYIL